MTCTTDERDAFDSDFGETSSSSSDDDDDQRDGQLVLNPEQQLRRAEKQARKVSRTPTSPYTHLLKSCIGQTETNS